MGRHRSSGPATEDSVYMNVIPMVDIMFLLLLFFMLTADFGSRELEKVKLAEGKTIKEDKQEEAKNRLNVNVFHTITTKDNGTVSCVDFDSEKPCQDIGHWNVAIRGRRYGSKQLEEWAKYQAKIHKKEKEKKTDAEAENPQVPTDLRVMIRCDTRAPFKFPQLLMEKLATAGIYKLEYGAAEMQKTNKPKQ